MIGNDLVFSTRQISDLVSRPSQVASPDYTQLKDQYITDAKSVADCQPELCEKDGVTYQFYFTGDVS